MIYSRLAFCAVGCALAAIVMSGCQTVRVRTFEMSRVAPHPGEVLKVDHIMILADVTGSTSERNVFRQEKSLLKAFVAAMPDLNYQMGFRSFAGGSQEDWMYVPLQTGTLEDLGGAAAGLRYLGGTTPLHEGVRVTGSEFEGRDGHAALLVFSDGRTHPHERVLKACEEVAYGHMGELCIYTVNVGYSKSGKALLEKMATVTGCGHAWQASEVSTPEGMEAMVREIFFAPGPEPEERTMVLPSEVLFDLDKAVLKPEGKAAVDRAVAEFRKQNLDYVVIEGHTCDLGSAAYNMDLSQRRANAVRSYMIEQGVDGGLITTEAYGESRPAVPNSGEPNRKLNRRAVIRYKFVD
ncbi:MAG: OmpA family protein [Candidatus Hydrogenedentes bacterium]|nr:OmpA family protein [Candidatus Hydrogenedentota bacterium]